MAKQNCRFIFETNWTWKWSNLIDQKILHISEFFIRVNICHYNNQICLKIIPTFMFNPGFLSEGLPYLLKLKFFSNRILKIIHFKWVLLKLGTPGRGHFLAPLFYHSKVISRPKKFDWRVRPPSGPPFRPTRPLLPPSYFFFNL